MRIVRGFLAAETARDWETWEGSLHPEVEYVLVGAQGAAKGCEHYLDHVRQTYADLPDWQRRIVHILARGNVVIAECEGSGHFSGTHRGRKHERTPLCLQTVYVFELERQRVRRVREYFDCVGYERQLLAGGPQEEIEEQRRSDRCRTAA
jgi:predicted ester cyclase